MRHSARTAPTRARVPRHSIHTGESLISVIHAAGVSCYTSGDEACFIRQIPRAQRILGAEARVLSLYARGVVNLFIANYVYLIVAQVEVFAQYSL